MRIGAILKKDASDPRTWASLAAAYFIPKVANAAVPLAAKAAAAMKGATGVMEPGDIGIISPRLGRVADLAQRVKNAAAQSAPPQSAPAPQPAAPAAPPAEAPPGATYPSPTEVSPLELTRALKIARQQQAATSPAETPGAGETPPPPGPPAETAPPTPPPSSPAPHPTRTAGQMSPTAIQSDLGIAARRMGVKLPPASEAAAQAEALVRQGASIEDAVKATAAPVKLKLSSAESQAYMTFRKQGMSGKEALEAVQSMRSFADRFGLPSNRSVSDAVKARNETGRWE